MNKTTILPITNENGYFEIRLESIGGLGANLCGKMLGELGALSLDLNSLSFSSYGSEKRGSPVKAYIRWCSSEKPVRVNSPVTHPHILGIFHEGLIGAHPVLDGVSVDTKIILNTPLSADEAAEKYHIVSYKYPVSRFHRKKPEKNMTVTLYEDALNGINIVKTEVAEESIKGADIPGEYLTFYSEIPEEEKAFYQSLAEE